MSTPDSPDKPSGSCLLCPPPREGQGWRLADRGYLTCSSCLDKLRETLQDIAKRYARLDPTPGASGDHGGRGAPGFGSRPPASPHVIVMTDRRSKSCEVSSDGIAYVWDPLADTVLQPGQYGPPAGAYVEKREVWYGADGRAHSEEARPPRSIPGTLDALAGWVAEEREIKPPEKRSVPDLALWLDQQLDWITRQELVVDIAQDLRRLHTQLKPVTGDQRVKVGECPVTIDQGAHTIECGTPLYAPTKGDTIICPNPACGGKWPRPEWERLGQILQAGAA